MAAEFTGLLVVVLGCGHAFSAPSKNVNLLLNSSRMGQLLRN